MSKFTLVNYDKIMTILTPHDKPNHLFVIQVIKRCQSVEKTILWCTLP